MALSGTRTRWIWEFIDSAMNTFSRSDRGWAAGNRQVCSPKRQMHQISMRDSSGTESVTVVHSYGCLAASHGHPETLPDYRTVFELSRIGCPVAQASLPGPGTAASSFGDVYDASDPLVAVWDRWSNPAIRLLQPATVSGRRTGRGNSANLRSVRDLPTRDGACGRYLCARWRLTPSTEVDIP